MSTEIPGYEHPEVVKTATSGKLYKTFTKGKKYKENKKESMYVNIEIQKDTCPVCKLEETETCPCAHSDKKCANNHTWYTDREGNIKVGNPH